MVRSLFLRAHSNSAKKRIFGSKKHYEEVVKPLRNQERVVEPLKYPASYTPTKWLPNGWCPPPEPEVAAKLRQSLPFQVGEVPCTPRGKVGPSLKAGLQTVSETLCCIWLITVSIAHVVRIAGPKDNQG